MNKNPKKLKVLHTSDWHLGKALYDKKRYDEFSQFLDWLIKFLKEQEIDILLIAGDIFDTSTPSNKAQELYYQFLSQVPTTGCRHVVVIGGNHDSPTFLNAPQNLLRALNVHVVGAASEEIRNEVIVLKDAENKTEMIICAVPFLRDRDIRLVEEGESTDDKNQNLIQGITNHYKEVENIARKCQPADKPVPMAGMGHLFTSGGKTTDGDGVRDLYVGSLAHVGESIFSKYFDYVALGHLHIAQSVGKSETIRYSGSPIQMGFGEAGQSKKVIIAEFEQQTTKITEHVVPIFQKLVKISGDLEAIGNEISALKNNGDYAWLELELTSNELASNITEFLDELVSESNLEILRIKNRFITERTLNSKSIEESLEELNEQEVFDRCLDIYQIQENEKELLKETYNEVLHLMQETDANAE